MAFRHVRGTLFGEYVRAIQSRNEIDWSRYLKRSDLGYLLDAIREDYWYPMAVYERLGLAILASLAENDSAKNLAYAWGRTMVAQSPELARDLVVNGDPRETLMRLRIHRDAFFDFDAVQLPIVTDQDAQLRLRYCMSATAEELAAYQTLGFIEELIKRAGGRSFRSRFQERAWEGASRSVLDLEWDFIPTLHPPTYA